MTALIANKKAFLRCMNTACVRMSNIGQMCVARDCITILETDFFNNCQDGSFVWLRSTELGSSSELDRAGARAD